MQYTRIVLKPQATWADVCTCGSDLEFSEKQWEQHAFSEYLVDLPYMCGWRSLDKQCDINYFQDPLREVRYYHLTGSRRSDFEAIIRKRVPIFTRAEIDALVASARTRAEKIVALYHAAATATPQLDPTFFEFLTRSLEDPDTTVRRAAVDATLFAFWTEFREPLTRVATTDPDHDLRAFAEETLNTLRTEAWEAPPGEFRFFPFTQKPERITPLTGVGDDWYQAAMGKRPQRTKPAPTPVASRKSKFQRPEWLVELMTTGNWDGVRWHTPDQIQKAASQTTEFTEADRVMISERELAWNRSAWESMVPVADGPEFTDRAGRTERARLFVNRDDATGGLLLALEPNHPPSLWIPVGRTRAGVDAAAAAYFFPGLPSQADLPYQGRLFLGTQASIGGEFADLEKGVGFSLFTDQLPWGSSQPSDPYPERANRNHIPDDDVQQFTAQTPVVFPQTCIHTRFSRAIIRIIDWKGAFFADLFFRPIPPLNWAEEHNARWGMAFPPGTPVDVVGALGGLDCLGVARLRSLAQAAKAQTRRDGLFEIVGFLERAPALS